MLRVSSTSALGSSLSKTPLHIPRRKAISLRNRLNAPLRAKLIRKAHLAKINNILLHVDQWLGKGEWDRASQYFHSKLAPEVEETAGLEDNSSRYQAYEHAVSLFASYHRFEEAAEVMQRMEGEGFIPSLSARAKLSAYETIQNGAEPGMLISVLEEVLRKPDFDEMMLLQLIRFLGDTLSVRPSLIDDITRTWTGHHGNELSLRTISYLVRLHTENGILETAQSWLQFHAAQAAEKGVMPDPGPYTTFLSAYARVHSLHSGTFAGAMSHMTKDGVTPDIAVFNSLISSQMTNRQTSTAFDTYKLLYENRGSQLSPDAYTFSSLFQALGRAENRRRKTKDSGIVPDPRDLYNNLLECHLIRTKGRLSSPSPAINQRVLNLALKEFMRRRDYPGAYVVLSSFKQCNLSADVTTSRIVIKTMLNRVKTQSRFTSGRVGRLWSGRFLANVDENLCEVPDREMIRRILALGKQIDMEEEVAIPVEPEKPKLLHVNLMTSGDVVRAALSHVDYISLKRIIRRAFLFDSDSPYYEVGQLEGSIKPMKVFSMAIFRAKAAMIPEASALKRHFATAKGSYRRSRTVLAT